MLKSFQGGTSCLPAGHGKSGRGIMRTVTSFVSCLFILTFSQLHDFSLFLLSCPFTLCYKHLFILAIYPLSFSGMIASFVRYCLSFATSLC